MSKLSDLTSTYSFFVDALNTLKGQFTTSAQQCTSNSEPNSAARFNAASADINAIYTSLKYAQDTLSDANS